jgi:hypothetical protein
MSPHWQSTVSHMRKLLVAALIAVSTVTFVHRSDIVDAAAPSCKLYGAVRLVQGTCTNLGSRTGFRVVGVAVCSCSIYKRSVYGEWWGNGGWSVASLPSSWYYAGWRFSYGYIDFYH